MASFAYKAINAKGQPVNGVMEALDRGTVVKSLTEQSLKPLSIKEVKEKASLSIPFLSGGKVKNDHIVIFTRELSAMVGAGVPLNAVSVSPLRVTLWCDRPHVDILVRALHKTFIEG